MKGGRLDVIGLGPGPRDWLTRETEQILERATDLVGYGPYLDRTPCRAGQARHPSDNRVEIDRAKAALELAAAGRRVALVSGGDPGVFAMAAALLETMEFGDSRWRALDVEIHPGVSAMLAAAARLGAPLGHDFCAISLSDNLKPWDIVARRLRAAAEADFVIAIYNPASKARPDQIHQAFDLLRAVKPASCLVAFARAIGRPEEKIDIATLATADPSIADMSTLVLVGSTQTRGFGASGQKQWIYTPRIYGASPR